jgi:murein DD-endopeptidase MepM/ murein hydrolase activator NlpD
MQILITDSSLVRTRALHFKRWQVALGGLLLGSMLLLLAGIAYHFVFLVAARDNWPAVNQLLKLSVRDEIAQRERVMRDNLDAIALRVGELQAKLVKLEALSERVTGMAGVKNDELKALPARAKGGQGGPFVPTSQPTLQEINEAIDHLDERTDIGSDVFTLVESRLFETRLQALLVPSSKPVQGPVGSGFGFRLDPFTGRAALHTGLDFPADPGHAILAAAGGMVIVSEPHAAYGKMIEIDHGNSLVTRYAHASKLLVKPGMMVKRGQQIAEVGNTGRSTGPHLHFEVLVAGVPQNPARFLAGQVKAPALVADASVGAPSKSRASRRRAGDDAVATGTWQADAASVRTRTAASEVAPAAAAAPSTSPTAPSAAAAEPADATP